MREREKLTVFKKYVLFTDIAMLLRKLLRRTKTKYVLWGILNSTITCIIPCIMAFVIIVRVAATSTPCQSQDFFAYLENIYIRIHIFLYWSIVIMTAKNEKKICPTIYLSQEGSIRVLVICGIFWCKTTNWPHNVCAYFV